MGTEIFLTTTFQSTDYVIHVQKNANYSISISLRFFPGKQQIIFCNYDVHLYFFISYLLLQCEWCKQWHISYIFCQALRVSWTVCHASAICSLLTVRLTDLSAFYHSPSVFLLYCCKVNESSWFRNKVY
jgi:hypothetical protein